MCASRGVGEQLGALGEQQMGPIKPTVIYINAKTVSVCFRLLGLERRGKTEMGNDVEREEWTVQERKKGWCSP